jgi:hypothetical protein
VSVSFNPHQGLIVIPLDLEGPKGSLSLEVAVDTGATRSLIQPHVLVFLGYDLAAQPQVSIATATGVLSIPW